MSEILPEQDCSFPDYTQKCVNYVNFKIATKQRNLSANTMFTTFKSLHHVYLIKPKKNKKTTRVTDRPLCHQEVCLVGHGDKVPHGRGFWTRIHPINTLTSWGNFIGAW